MVVYKAIPISCRERGGHNLGAGSRFASLNCGAPEVLTHDEYLGYEDDNDTKMSHTVIRHTKTCTYSTDRFINYDKRIILLIKWEWVIIKVFILVISTLSRMRRWRKRKGWSFCLRDGREGRGRRGNRHTLGITLWKYIVISVWLSCLFISLKMFLYSTNFPTICSSFSAIS